MTKSTKLLIALAACTVLLITTITLIVGVETRDSVESNGIINSSGIINQDATDPSQETNPTEPKYDTYYTLGGVAVYSDCAASDQIAMLPPKTELQCIEAVDEHWMKINYNGSDAYVLLEYLTDTLEPQVEENIVLEDFEDEYGNVYRGVNEEVQATGNVHVRLGPSMKFAKLGIIPEHGKVIRIGVGENGWSKVIYHGVEGYVTSYYLATTKTANYEEVEETVYAIKTVNIRTGPTIKYTKLGELEEGASIIRVGIGDNGWSKVIYNGEEAYMYSLYLTTELVDDTGKDNITDSKIEDEATNRNDEMPENQNENTSEIDVDLDAPIDEVVG